MPGRRAVYEVVVAGAGPVGLLFAWRLVRAGGFRVRVVDAGRPAIWQATDVDPRVYALSRESQWLLGELWQEIVRRRVSPYRSMRVWEGEQPFDRSSVLFDAAEIGEPDLGAIVEDNLLRHTLREALLTSGVELEYETGVEGLDRDGRDKPALSLSDGRVLHPDLVVGADGIASRVRAAAGIESFSKDYRQKAIVSHVTTAGSNAQTAWQRFLPEGPLAFLPLADGRSSIVWTLGSETADRLLAADDEAFLRELESASAGALGRLGPCTARLSFPLRLSHALRYTGSGMALIGDAAHAVHPLAGQGMNLGLRDAGALARTLAAAAVGGEYPGDAYVLARYERLQKAHNLGMQLAFDGINELFGRHVPGWAASLRAVGLGVANRLEPAKRLLMRQALGLDSAFRDTPDHDAA